MSLCDCSISNMRGGIAIYINRYTYIYSIHLNSRGTGGAWCGGVFEDGVHGNSKKKKYVNK